MEEEESGKRRRAGVGAAVEGSVRRSSRRGRMSEGRSGRMMEECKWRRREGGKEGREGNRWMERVV